MNFTPKPDTFVLVVAALSEKLVQKETECVEMAAHIAADHAEMDEMQRTLTDKRRECEDLYTRNDNLTYDINRLQDKVYDLDLKARNYDHIFAENARLREEIVTLKYGVGDPETRVRNFMLKEGGKLWSEGMKIQCIKGVRECTGWGLKESKDYSEAWGPKYAPESDECPKTKPSQDGVRQTG